MRGIMPDTENAEMQMMVIVPNLALKKYSFLLFPLSIKNFGFDFFSCLLAVWPWEENKQEKKIIIIDAKYCVRWFTSVI